MLATPHCFTRGCVHLQGVFQPHGEDEDAESHELDEVPVCTAYPRGIPFDIAYAEPEVADLHDEIRSDQVGTDVFEAQP